MNLNRLWPVQRARLQNSLWQQQGCNRLACRGPHVACSDSSSGPQHPGCYTAAVTASVAPAAPSQDVLAPAGDTARPAPLPGPSAAAPPPHPQAPSKDAILIRRRARAARRAGNAQLALDILQDGLQQHPGDGHLTVAAASAAAKLGLANDALQLISPLLQQQPNNPQVLTAAAAAFRAKGDLSTARRCYEAAAAAAPTNEVVLQAWGVLEAAAGRADAARALFRQAVAVRPQHMAAYVAWAQLEGQAGNVAAARSLHRQAHDINPMSATNLHVSSQAVECHLARKGTERTGRRSSRPGGLASSLGSSAADGRAGQRHTPRRAACCLQGRECRLQRRSGLPQHQQLGCTCEMQ